MLKVDVDLFFHWHVIRFGANKTRVLVLPKLINMNIPKILSLSATWVQIFQCSFSYFQNSSRPCMSQSILSYELHLLSIIYKYSDLCASVTGQMLSWLIWCLGLWRKADLQWLLRELNKISIDETKTPQLPEPGNPKVELHLGQVQNSGCICCH